MREQGSHDAVIIFGLLCAILVLASCTADGDGALSVTDCPDSHQCLSLAASLHANKDCAAAIGAYERAVQGDSKHRSDATVMMNYGSCLLSVGRNEAAAAALRSAVHNWSNQHIQKDKISSQSEEILIQATTNLALALTTLGHGDDALEAWKSRLDLELRRLRKLWRYKLDPRRRADPNATDVRDRRPLVVLFARTRADMDPQLDIWSPSDIDGRGLTGSEEAVVYLSRALVDLGYRVDVYGNPPRTRKSPPASFDGVRFLPFYAIDTSDASSAPDVLISWRNVEGSLLWWGSKNSTDSNANREHETRKTARYLWLHDIVDEPELFTPRYSRRIDGVLVLSEFHMSLLPHSVSHKAIVTANGISSEYFLDGINHPNTFITAGWPTVGLEIVLCQWGRIRENLIKAAAKLSTDAVAARGGKHNSTAPTLHVYYGFQPWMQAQYGDLQWFIDMKRRINKLLKQPGVKSHGMVSHRKMAKAMANAGYYLYPTSKPETSAIALMKAQANGAIPITSRYPTSALEETAGCFDAGPSPPLNHVQFAADVQSGAVCDGGAASWSFRWGDAVIEASMKENNGDENVNRQRSKMKAWARDEFQWNRVAKQWSLVFDEAVHTVGIVSTNATHTHSGDNGDSAVDRGANPTVTSSLETMHIAHMPHDVQSGLKSHNRSKFDRPRATCPP